jgi:hypothetical protein
MLLSVEAEFASSFGPSSPHRRHLGLVELFLIDDHMPLGNPATSMGILNIRLNLLIDVSNRQIERKCGSNGGRMLFKALMRPK